MAKRFDESDARYMEFPEYIAAYAAAAPPIDPDTDLRDYDETALSESDALFRAASTPSPREHAHAGPREISFEEFRAPRISSFSSTAFIGGFAAIAWLAAAIGFPVSYYGAEALLAAPPATQAGLIAVAMGPAILIWLAAAAVAEAARAGRVADELARIARDAVLPLQNPNEALRRVTFGVRREIEELHAAVDGAYARLAALRSAAAQHALIFEETIGEALTGAESLTQNLKSERDAFTDLNADLKGQTETVANTIGRQVRLMREASKLVKAELGDAEHALETHLSQFRSTAASITQSTAELGEAAHAACEASGHLDETLNGALGGLAQAAKLTDAARQSTETAVLAAKTTANAVRETAQRAIADAKRIAELIREETKAMRNQAVAALADMRDGKIETALIEAPQNMPQSLHAAAAVIAERQIVRIRMSGLPNLNHLLPKPPNDAAALAPLSDELVAFPLKPDGRAERGALDLIADAGVSLGETLSERDLDAAASAARKSVAARRLAVLDAAPVAVTRLARFLRRDPAAKKAALAFRERADLAKPRRGKKSKSGADLMRAYLLVDAALG